MPSEDCWGWFSGSGSYSGAWDTRHCLLAGRSIGEGEVGWSILVIKMDWISSCAQGSFIADKPRRGCCHFCQCLFA
ncbi:unnamed protein product [Penicillium nalgiovense]|nr:unnamed protein product [Penicillium nalgiovense]